MKKKKKSSSEGRGPPPRPLPRDITVEILLRLPVKSLCRFRCVSTLWRSIISDPHFVSSHFARSSAHPKLQINVDRNGPAVNAEYVRKRRDRFFFFSTDYTKNMDDPGQVQVASYHGQIDTHADYIPQSVGGLICISDIEGIQVCNPSTGECITFPAPSIYGKPFLGYDPVEKKHKIINSWKSRFLGPTKIDILTLGEKEWRRLDLGLPGLSIELSLCMDGVMHMLGETDEEKAYFILFDVRLETFRAIPFPADFVYDPCMCLIEFGGRAALLDYWASIIDRVGGPVRLWILEDLEVWSCKEFIPPPHLDDTISVVSYCDAGVTHAGELVFSSLSSTGPFLCYLLDLEDASLRKIEISGLHERLNALTRRYDDMVTVYSHVESLQSLQEFRIDR
ncbi:putative F-box protein At1g47790 [Punica granatum]|uniref:F-box protein At1g47790 n=1 Tax=Punica granatum TaxID=22663 RepID=A0A218WPR2_PUNGR|nr:putative F-box protein At1g47790 [Punica granatum]OWM74626.1 hypothetical protein CDL15_Pgr005206 [Punica granatum]